MVALGPPSELMDGLGAWAVDVLNGADMRTSCFRGREEAQAFGAAGPGSFTLRRVNLEDVFHATTGRKLTNGASA